jgi:hypothetical protein
MNLLRNKTRKRVRKVLNPLYPYVKYLKQETCGFMHKVYAPTAKEESSATEP